MGTVEPRAVIVIGASAGGVGALLRLVAGLPPGLPAAIFVVVHISPGAKSTLPKLLTRAGAYEASEARNAEVIEAGRIYVAPPDQHLVVRKGAIELSRTARINRHRPAADALFHSAARAYSDRVIGIVLSGALDDGTIGLMAVKSHGGRAIVQDPEEAEFPGMPSSAVAHVKVDHVVTVAQMPAVIGKLVGALPEPYASEGGTMNQPRVREIDQAEEIVRRDFEAQERGERHGEPSTYTCPECGGTIWQLEQGNVVRFQCHTGHAYSLQSMLVGQTEELEQALWSAIRMLSEKASLARQAVSRFKGEVSEQIIQRYQEQADAAQHSAGLIRGLIETGVFSEQHEGALADAATEEAMESVRR
jgi:two-component system, chemotaxis family, protein-glutamate methylesterase/glutaminase